MTITRTTTLQKNNKLHRSGLIFDENGDILNNLENRTIFLLNQLQQNNNLVNLANNNDNTHSNYNTIHSCSSATSGYSNESGYSATASSKSLDILSLGNGNLDDGDLKFIDDDNNGSDSTTAGTQRDKIGSSQGKFCSNCKEPLKSQSEWNISSKKVKFIAFFIVVVVIYRIFTDVFLPSITCLSKI